MKTIKKLTIFACILFFNSLIGQSEYNQIQTLLTKAEEARLNKDYDEGLKLAYQAKSIYSKNNLDTIHIRIYNKLAKIYHRTAAYDSSMHYCKKSLEIDSKKLKFSKAYAQTLELTAKTHSLLGSIPKAIDYHKQSLELKKQLYPKIHTAMANQYWLYGIELRYHKKYKFALQQFQIAEDILNKIKGNRELKIDVYDYISDTYTYLFDLDSALKYAKLKLNLVKKEFGPNSSKMADAYSNFSFAYRYTGNIKKAIKYIKLREKIVTESSSINQFNLASIYYDLSGIYNQLFEYSRAIKYYEKTILILERDPKKFNFNLGRCYYFMGNTYRKLNENEEAIKYMEKGKELLIKSLGKNHPDIAAIDSSIADCLDINNDFEQALSYHKKALKIYENFETPYIDAKSSCHDNIASIYRQTKRFRKALIHDHKLQLLYAFNKYSDGYINALQLKALDHCSLNQLDSAAYYLNLIPKFLNYNEKKAPYQFNNVKHSKELSNYLNCKVHFYNAQFSKSKNTVYLDSIHQQSQKFLASQEYCDDQYGTPIDKLQRIQDHLNIYENCIDSYTKHNHFLDSRIAFEIAEKTKSRLLKINLNAIKANDFSNVPDSLLTKEVTLKKSIAKFEKLRFESTNDSITKDCTNQLFKLKRQKDELDDLLLKEYPRFHNLKYNNKVISVSSLQQNLTNNEIIIEYYIGKENIYLYTITKNNYNVISFETPNDLEQWVTQLRNSIYNYDDDEQLKNYLKSAHKLYSTLIAPIKNELKQKLIIIPDGILNYIPFETLLEKKVDQFISYKGLPYLIKNHQISYNYSATLYHQLLTQKSEAAKENLLAFAPSFKDNKEKFESIKARRNGFENLLYNIPEAEMAHEYISGALFKGNKATEENFLKNAEDYKIIHLSTHAKSNDKLGDYSFIAMSKVNDSIDHANRIYTSELYNLNLKADMVVLSACETGLGKLQGGEGIISLARAFTYAGAKSTINSLWSVNDASTKTLMEEFYKNIKAGKTKDQALHEAKLSYLENEDMDAPYFWASFIAMGNMEPITLNSSSHYYWYFLLLIPILFVLANKRRK